MMMMMMMFATFSAIMTISKAETTTKHNSLKVL